MKAQKSNVLKRKFKNLMSITKKVISNQIKQIKSHAVPKIRQMQNTPKRVSNRGINNFSVNATRNTPKIVIEKPSIVV